LRKAGQNSFSATSAGSASSSTIAASLLAGGDRPGEGDAAEGRVLGHPLAELVAAGDDVEDPAGMSSRSNSPIATVTTGVNGDGLSATAQPARKAGAMVLTAMPIGTFHGLMAAMTPIGRRTTSTRAASSSWTVTRGISRSA
jgi:hypothetical protein